MAEERAAEVRVLEIRQAENGWVISGFEREQQEFGDGFIYPYFSMVAETPKRCTEIIGQLLVRESWRKAVEIRPARRERKVVRS